MVKNINFNEINTYLKLYVNILNLIIKYIKNIEKSKIIENKTLKYTLDSYDTAYYKKFVGYLITNYYSKNLLYLAKYFVLILNEYFENKYLFIVKKVGKNNNHYIIIECKNILNNKENLYIGIKFRLYYNDQFREVVEEYFTNDINIIKKKLEDFYKKQLSSSSISSS